MFDKLYEYQINPTDNIDEKKAVQDDKQQDENEAINHLGSSHPWQIPSQKRDSSLPSIMASEQIVHTNQEPIESNDKGACNCVLRNVDGEIQTWRPILFLVSLHIAMYG